MVQGGGDNKTEESEITMQDEEGMMRKKGSETEYRKRLKKSTLRAALMACGYTERRGSGEKR